MSETTNNLDVAIMMGSKSDLDTMQPAAKVLEQLGLAVEVRVLSAHRTPEETAAFVKDAGRRGRQGVHLRRGRRGAPGGRGRGAHHAAGHRRPVVCGQPGRSRFAAVDGADAAGHAGRDGRDRRRGERRPAGGADHRASPTRRWRNASRPSGPPAARRCSTATPRSAASPGPEGGRAATTRQCDGTRLRRRDRLRGRGASARRGRRLSDRDVLRPGRRRAGRARAGAPARSSRAGTARRSRCWSTGRRCSTACARPCRRSRAALMRRHWPGALTIALPARPNLPSALVDAGCVAVRQSSHPTAQALVSRLGRPLTTTSANLAGGPPATTAEAVEEIFEGRCRVVHGGATAGGAPSTLVRVRGSKIEILRRGAIEIDPDPSTRDKG